MPDDKPIAASRTVGDLGIVPADERSADLAADLPGASLADKLDALHGRHFAGTALTTHTTLWNMVHAFKEDVKKLLPET